ELFRANGMPPTSYKFEVADAAAFLESLGEDSFDTVFSFGLLYYTTEPYRLLRLMCRVASKTVLLDTFTAAYAVIQGKDALKVYPRISPKTLELPLMLFARTQPEKKDYRLPETFQHRGREISLTSLPTPALLELWFQSLGMKFQKLDWSDYILGPRTYHDLVTTDQKRKSHWADIYSSEVRVAYRLSPKMR
ncbi:MAG: SAM-dependent methyltransferase, partial [Nitrospinaceae bacterium]|nr:SAM-dependent methyltransferase [Nitrospinaceae bacterium]NIS85574.1 SAM-dependent methyltransferase [Nitrospinaceae bacterium]NIU96790.1 SAM-dependent methyltransferase [Nitrospinaceae bacterium]